MSVLNSALPSPYYAITQSGIFYVFHYTHPRTWENSQSAELHLNERRIIIAIFISIQCLNNFSSFSHEVVDNWMSFALLLIQFWLNFALMFCALLNRMSGVPFAPSLPMADNSFPLPLSAGSWQITGGIIPRWLSSLLAISLIFQSLSSNFCLYHMHGKLWINERECLKILNVEVEGALNFRVVPLRSITFFEQILDIELKFETVGFRFWWDQ